MAFEKKFEIKLYVPEHWDVSEDMKERWRENSKRAALIAHKRLITKIGIDADFINQMATTSKKAYQNYVNPAYLSKGGRTAEDIINAQSENMKDKFPRWIKNLARAYAEVDGIPAKLFNDKIDAATENWAYEVGKKSIRLTGDKIRGRSVVPITAYYLVGDPRASAWLREGDKGGGTPYQIGRDYERSALKSALQQHLVQGGLLIINGEYQAGPITQQNKRNASLLNNFRDPARCDQFVETPVAKGCFCLWEMDDTFLLLHIQVGLTV